MFKVAELTITKNLRQLKCPSVGEWINKCLHIHPTDYHSAVKRNEVLDTYNNKMILRGVILRKRNKSQKLHTT